MTRAFPSAVGFLVVASWVPWWLSPASPRWIVLFLCVPLALVLLRWKVTLAHALLAAWLGYAAASCWWSPDTSTSMLWLARFAVLTGAFCLGSSLPSIRWILAGMLLALPLATYTNSFGNPQMLAEVAAPLAAFCLIAGWRWWAGFAAAILSLWVASQPGAWLALALAFMVWVWRRRASNRAPSARRERLLATALAMVAAGAVVWMWQAGGPMRASIVNRLEIWRDGLALLTPWGRGIGSFETAYAALPVKASTDAATVAIQFAHNEPLHFAVELGIGALFLLGVAAFAWHRGRHHEPECAALVATVGCALVAFPLHAPAAGFLAAVVAGWLCRPRHDAGDHDGGQRAALRAGGRRAGFLHPLRRPGARPGNEPPGPARDLGA